MTKQIAAPMTFESLLARIEADPELTQVRARNLTCSIRRFVEVCGRTLQSEASFPSVRRWIENATPLARGVSKRRWGNIRCDVRLVLERYGAPTRAPLRGDLSPDWARLRNLVDDAPRFRRGLSNLFHWCSREGIAPADVCDAVMGKYLADLRERSLRCRPEKRFRDTCKLWNCAADSYSDWSRVRVSVPSYRKTVSFPWNAFPPSFLDDLDRYCAFMSGRDLLAENAPASPRRETTLQAHREHLKRFASGLVHAGFPMEDLTSLSVLVEARQFETALRFHLERFGGKPRPSLFETASILVVMSREYLRLDDDRIEELSAVRNRLRCRERGMTEKNRERLRPLVEPVNQLRFLTMSDQLLKRAGSRKSPKRRALDVQIAVVHELMLMAPMRFGNLTRLNLDRHFRTEGTGRHRRVFIVIHPDEVKNAQTLEFELLEPTIRLLDLYLKEFRPLLLHGPEEGWLFPGAKGGHKHQVTLSQQLCAAIECLVGLVFNPHLFRHAAVFFYLREHPGDYETPRQLLGHTSVETTMKFYAAFEALAARKRYAELILERRTEGLASLERSPW